jgi:hypothetical protein
VIAGLFAVSGILGLYTGLAVGRMGVVAPVTGLLAAALPVVVSVAGQGLPQLSVSAGILLALVAVVLVSRSEDPSGRRSGIEVIGRRAGPHGRPPGRWRSASAA